MDVATLVISACALLISIAASGFAYMQAKAAKMQAEAAVKEADATSKALEIEAKRWRAERKPPLECLIDFMSPAAHLLRLTSLADKEIVVLDISFVENDGVRLVETGKENEFPRHIRPGATTQVWVSVPEPYPASTRIDISCRGSVPQDRWNVLLSVPIFPSLSRRRPRISMSIEQAYPPPHKLVARLDSHESLRSIEVALPKGNGISFDGDFAGGGSGSLVRRHDGLDPGQSVAFAVDIAPLHPHTIDLPVVCTGANQEKWHLNVGLPIPPSLSVATEPDLDIRIERNGQGHQIKVRLVSMWPLDSIEALVAEVGETRFIGIDGRLSNKARCGRLNPGQSAVWKVYIQPWVGGLVPFFDILLSCSGLDGENWEISRRQPVADWLM